MLPEIVMTARWFVLGLSVLLASAAYAEPAANDQPANTAGKKSAEKPVKPAAKKAGKKTEKRAEKPAEQKAEPKKSDEPKTTTVDKLPGALRTAHTCAMPNA